MFSIKDHFLHQNNIRVPYKASPNIGSGVNKLQYLVEHYTATFGFSSPLAWLTTKESGVSAHLLIGKKGEIYQLASFNKICWHAGKSLWKGIDGLNSSSIGIEIVNSGTLQKRSTGYYSADGNKVEHYKEATNTLGFKAVWEEYPKEQMDVVIAVSKALKAHYKLEIVGHEDISPGRKTDPGPLFPWNDIKVEFKTLLANLNVRDCPFDTAKIVKVLPKDSLVSVVKEEGEWSQIDIGWVSSKYLK